MSKKSTNIVSENYSDKQLSEEDIDIFFEGTQDYEYDPNHETEMFESSPEPVVTAIKEQPILKKETPKRKEQSKEQTTHSSSKYHKIKDNRPLSYKELITPVFEDVMGYLDYDEDKRKQDAFQFEYTSGDPLKDESEILSENFQDFLIMNKITGKSTGFEGSSYYPASRLIDQGKKVKILDDAVSKKQDKHDSAKVTILKNSEGEIESIEIECTCGENIIIELNYDSEEKNDEIFSKVVGDEPNIVHTKNLSTISPKSYETFHTSSKETNYKKEIKDYSFEEEDDFEKDDDRDKQFSLDYLNETDDFDNADIFEQNNDDDEAPLLTLDDLKDI